MVKLVTIFGGSGFVGRYVARRMAREGWRVRVAVRRPNEALFVRTYGAVGQVEPVLCNVRDAESVRQALRGADVAINCVGILNEVGRNTFGLTQYHGARHIAEAAQEMGVRRVVQISAIGADPQSDSEYAATKGTAEEVILKHVPEAVILRPSIIFGPEDQFFNRFAGVARFSPVLPLFGAGVRFQPVYVDDVAQAAVLAATGKAGPGVYELGGPEVKSFADMMYDMLDTIHRPGRIVVGLPLWFGSVMGWGLDLLQKLTGSLFVNKVITRDQAKNLARNNVAGEDTMGFADLGMTPVALGAVLPEYLWRFRPSGQYEDVRESVGNLRRPQL
ncbi:NADH dehydrogenase [Rhodovulum imhoffii]|uniref:NADH dehydrogenase n=1 Tax=Rhodovulum imhoffii TaxID=365340 RepID=A0A2T5BPA2_9RHOB|nr:complex I NDUFA9 subunit family protein [Rhodovulum imhoffii]MBK5932901.1 complex I NDUFA9 subunit family protein [Rhodovulum imhoffii]PTN00837.1 NADH dehydrogenase [Rhodovulum imhoffii]